MRKLMVTGGLFAAVGFGAFAATSAHATNYTLNPSSTLSIRAGASDGTLFVGDDAVNYRRGFINFSLAPLAGDLGNILSATFNLAPQSFLGATTTNLFIANTGTQDTSLTGTALGSMTSSPTAGTYESISNATLLAAVTGWRTTPASNNGIYVDMASGLPDRNNFVDFYTSGTGTIPQLVLVTQDIESSSAPEPTSMIVLTSATALLSLRSRRRKIA